MQKTFIFNHLLMLYPIKGLGGGSDVAYLFPNKHVYLLYSKVCCHYEICLPLVLPPADFCVICIMIGTMAFESNLRGKKKLPFKAL